jgi:hypothetical protein
MPPKEIYYWVESETENVFGFPNENGRMNRIFTSVAGAKDALRRYADRFDSDPSKFILYDGEVKSIKSGDQLIDDL